MGALLQGAAPLEQEEVDGRRGAIGLTSEGGGISSNSQYGRGQAQISLALGNILMRYDRVVKRRTSGDCTPRSPRLTHKTTCDPDVTY